MSRVPSGAPSERCARSNAYSPSSTLLAHMEWKSSGFVGFSIAGFRSARSGGGLAPWTRGVPPVMELVPIEGNRFKVAPRR